MGNFLPNDKLEEAFAALITPAVAAIDPKPQVVTGKSTADKSLAIVRCVASGEGDMDPPMSGNFWISGSIQVRYPAVPDKDGDRKADNQALLTAVSGAINVTDLAQQLSNAVDDFTVFPNGVIFGAPTSGQDRSGAWIDELPFRVYCCGSDIPA